MEDLDRLTARVHNNADDIARIKEGNVRRDTVLDRLERDVAKIIHECVTTKDLTAAVQLQAHQLAQLAEELKDIKASGQYWMRWVVGLVGLAVVGALLNLVIKR